MTIHAILAIAAAGIVAAAVLAAPRIVQSNDRKRWMAPAALSAIFLLFSLVTVVQEGPFGFWAEHTRSFWGNQVWFDLLLGIGTAFLFFARRAKNVGMNVVAWGIFTLATGSIGLLAAVARLLYLESKAAA